MSEICWYCYWGWAKPVAEIYLKALEKLQGDSSPLHYGPAHIVWEDENWDSAEWCLEHIDTNNTVEDLEVIRWSLEELVKIPLADREIEPENYDGVNPEKFPPTAEVVKV